MCQNVLNIPVVQDAMEAARQRLDEQVGKGIRDCMEPGAAARPTRKQLEELVRQARQLGALDAICAQYGITEAVMSRMA